MALIRSSDPERLCSIEIGIKKGTTYTIIVGDIRKVWPEKVGELLVSMYFFATCNYLNNLRNVPAAITWTTYGIFVVRGVACLVLSMVLDREGCNVYPLHEGSAHSLDTFWQMMSVIL